MRKYCVVLGRGRGLGVETVPNRETQCTSKSQGSDSLSSCKY